jgi:hypothetical protein
MSTAKRTIHLTDDNWADYFPNDYPKSLAKGSRRWRTGHSCCQCKTPVVFLMPSDVRPQ